MSWALDLVHASAITAYEIEAQWSIQRYDELKTPDSISRSAKGPSLGAGLLAVGVPLAEEGVGGSGCLCRVAGNGWN